MAFKQFLRSEYAHRLDETYQQEDWAEDFPGRAYYDVHLSVIEEHETATAVFRELLGGGGLRVLESGCGTGRWMAFFERLGNRAVGLDDSAGPLAVAHEHDPTMNLVRADALRAPFADASFDAALSCYVAEHFEDGPEALFREIHRMLKPDGLFFVVVPYDNTVRRLVVNQLLRAWWVVWRLRGRTLGFTEFRYTREDMDGFLGRTGFRVDRVVPDDYRPPWNKGLYNDLCDVGSFVNRVHQPPFEFGPFGRGVVRAIRSLGEWHSCAGILYVARALK